MFAFWVGFSFGFFFFFLHFWFYILRLSFHWLRFFLVPTTIKSHHPRPNQHLINPYLHPNRKTIGHRPARRRRRPITIRSSSSSSSSRDSSRPAAITGTTVHRGRWMLHGRRKVALIATITLTCHLLLSITVTTVTKTTPMAASIQVFWMKFELIYYWIYYGSRSLTNEPVVQVMEVVWIDTATVEAEPTACTVKRLLRHLRSTECLPAGTTSRPDSITTTSLRPENSSSSSNRGMVAVASTWLNIAIKEDQPLNCIKNQVNHEVTSCTWNTPPGNSSPSTQSPKYSLKFVLLFISSLRFWSFGICLFISFLYLLTDWQLIQPTKTNTHWNLELTHSVSFNHIPTTSTETWPVFVITVRMIINQRAGPSQVSVNIVDDLIERYGARWYADREFAAVTANRLQSTTLHRRLLRRPTVRWSPPSAVGWPTKADVWRASKPE